MDAEHDAASASPASPSVQEVAAQLEQIALTSAARAFCALLWQRTLGSGAVWCDFDLAAWSSALGWTKAQRSNLRRIRDALVQRNIIVFTPDPLVAGKGRIGWTLEVETWQPYDRRTRTQQKQARLVKYEAQITNHACSEPAQITNPASLEAHAPTAVTPDEAAPSPNALAVPAEQFTQWHADLMVQRQHVADLRQARQSAVAAWEHCCYWSDINSLFLTQIGLSKCGEAAQKGRARRKVLERFCLIYFPDYGATFFSSDQAISNMRAHRILPHNFSSG